MASGGTISKTRKQPSAEIRVTPLRIPNISVVPKTLLIHANSEASGKTGYEISESGRYTGKDYDEATGLYYYNARWYDAALGRFLTEDPARDGANWYVYVRNNPLKYVDPTGLRIIKDNDETGRPVTETGKEVGERHRKERVDRREREQERLKENIEKKEAAIREWEESINNNYDIEQSPVLTNNSNEEDETNIDNTENNSDLTNDNDNDLLKLLKRQRNIGYVSVVTGTAAVIVTFLKMVPDVLTDGDIEVYTALAFTGSVKSIGIGIELIRASKAGKIMELNLGILTP